MAAPHALPTPPFRAVTETRVVVPSRLSVCVCVCVYVCVGWDRPFFLCCGQAFWIRSPRGSTPTAAMQLQRGTGRSYASLPLTGTSPDPVPRFSRFGVQKRWRGASLLCLAIGVFALGLEVQL